MWTRRSLLALLVAAPLSAQSAGSIVPQPTAQQLLQARLAQAVLNVHMIRLNHVDATIPGFQSDPAGGPALHVHLYRLQHTNAAALAPTLQSLFTLRGPVRAATSSLDTSAIRGARASRDSAWTRDTIATRSPATSLSMIRVVAEASTNSVLVRSTDSDWLLIQQIIQRIDQ